jgi:hypothetical protein
LGRKLATRSGTTGSAASAAGVRDCPATVRKTSISIPADAGANIAIVTRFDDVMFECMFMKGGLTVAALSQVAADLLTSPGRRPNEAEAFMQWMQENEVAWRR